MINRVLIRMKTVQLLYSYLLVDKPFTLESQPSAPTKEKRFAYGLYLDLIFLMFELSRKIKGKSKTYPLSKSRFILKVAADDHFKSLLIKYSGTPFPFGIAEDTLIDQIKDSLLFREFEKNYQEGVASENFWEDVFNSILMFNPTVNKIIREMPGYTLSGVERMKEIMSETFKNFYSSKDNIDDALKTLKSSMLKARDLYMRLLALPVDLTKLRIEQLEQNRKKYLTTTEDLNPNMRFVNNFIPSAIENNTEFEKYAEQNHLSWMAEDPELLDHLLKDVIDSDVYTEYISLPNTNAKTDADFWKNILVEVILNNQYFLEYLENKSVFWNDDLEIMASFVLKTFKRFEDLETRESAVMPMYKDGDNGKDSQFGAQLFNYVIINKEVYRNYIEESLIEEKWDAGRLAFMDVVITMTALAEIINYPEIPLQVTINEYIEIAKSYSSAKSGQFVNGLIASILPKLRSEGLIKK